MRRFSLPRTILLLALLLAPFAGPAQAQLSSLARGGSGPPVSRTEPVTFNADHVSYDRQTGIVTATGNVEAWQNGRVIRADKITFNRNTDVAAASGHVAMVEPDGQVLFADYAELTQGMRDATLAGMRAILAQNGKLAANGARRIGGQVNQLSRAVYSTCNVCALDPTRPPLWQIRAYSATQDLQHKKIEYRDAYLEFFGVPVAYLPYFANADPSVKRQSGLLVPSVIAYDKHIGTGIAVPYYLVIDNSSDAVITPTVATKSGPQVQVEYRKDLNNGIIRARGAVAYDEGAPQAYLFAQGLFNYNDTWRYGFNVNRATSTDYLRDFKIPGYSNTVLPSSVYAEGFGVGAYTRIDVQAYQAIATSVIQDELPFVLPRYLYSFEGQPDALGGRTSFSTQEWNVLRQVGTSDQRLGMEAEWNRPFDGPAGQRYLFTARAAGAAYNAHDLTRIPNYQAEGSAASAQALPTVAVKMDWPFVRYGGGTQTIEPIVQLIGAPNAGNSARDHLPNEDSLAYEFNDTTLFSLNRYAGGYDRQDGGLRANVGLHGNWSYGPSQLDALVGESFRDHIDQNMIPDTGLAGHASDIVARTTVSPVPWLDLIGRARLDHNNGNVHYGEGLASVGTNLLRVNGGYIYSSTDPYYYYDNNYLASTTPPASFFVPRHEATVGVNANYGFYHASAYAQRDLQSGKMVAVGLDGHYDNECFIFDVNFSRRYTSIDNDSGDTSIIFTLTFKTVGAVGFNAS